MLHEQSSSWCALLVLTAAVDAISRNCVIVRAVMWVDEAGRVRAG